MIRDTWPATLASLESIQAFIKKHAAQAEFDIRSFPSLFLIVEEIIVNIITHAYKNTETGIIDIQLRFLPDRIRISFSDTGPAFDPLNADPPDITNDIEKKNIGGLGIYMVTQLADEIHYHRCNGKNILTVTLGIKKKITHG